MGEHAPMAEDGANARNRRAQDHERRAAELAGTNAERIHALPAHLRPGATAPMVIKVEALVALWTAGDPEREAEFSAAYQAQLALALDELERKAAEEAGPKLVRPGLAVPPRRPG